MDRDINEQVEVMCNRYTVKVATGNEQHLKNAIKIIKTKIRNDLFLLNAVHVGNCETVTDMLQLGASVEAIHIPISYSAIFMTPLQIAASHGYVDIVQILIDHGANVHAENKSGTALHVAARNGHCECLKVLLQAGADAFASIGMLCKAEAFDRLAASALNIAVKNNHIDCVQELLEYGLDCDAFDENGQSFRFVVALHAIYKCVSTAISLTTLLKAAAKTGNYRSETAFLSLLPISKMEHCADILQSMGSLKNDIKSNGISQLPVLPSTGFEDIDLEIFKLFMLESYCIDHHIPRGLTALHHFYFEYYNSKIAAILITCFADISFKRGHIIFNINLIEYLLNTSQRFGPLKYVVKCILWVPHLNSLTVLPFVNELPMQNFCDENVENLVLPPNVAFALKRDETRIYVEIHDRENELTELQLMYYDIVRGVPRYGRYPLQEPLISLISERISDEIDQLKLIIKDYDVHDTDYLPKNHYHSELLKLKKHLWYEKIAFNPPTLQQCCRYSLLKCMGPLNVKNIRKLPLPSSLKSYLLFQ